MLINVMGRAIPALWEVVATADMVGPSTYGPVPFLARAVGGGPCVDVGFAERRRYAADEVERLRGHGPSAVTRATIPSDPMTGEPAMDLSMMCVGHGFAADAQAAGVPPVWFVGRDWVVERVTEPWGRWCVMARDDAQRAVDLWLDRAGRAFFGTDDATQRERLSGLMIRASTSSDITQAALYYVRGEREIAWRQRLARDRGDDVPSAEVLQARWDAVARRFGRA